jgi:hypothetical protein
MSATPRILASLAALGLAGYALALLVDAEMSDVADQAGRDEAGVSLEDLAQSEHDEVLTHVRTMDERRANPNPFDFGEEDEGELPAIQFGSGIIDRSEARAGFDYAMRQMESVGRKRRRISQEQWKAAYRAANDAFSALSTHLDAQDPLERDELEKAHRRLVDALASVRVKGGKLEY